MTEKSKAQRLADILQHKIPSIECLEQAAAELRRLDALNDELLGAIANLINVRGRHHTEIAYQRLIAAYNKAKEQK